MKTQYKLLALALSMMAAGACAKDNNDNGAPQDTAAVPESTAAAPAAPAAPTDAQIAHIGSTSHTLEISAGTDAQAKATNADVKAFAAKMVKEHKAANAEGEALAKKANITPEDNPTSQQMVADGDRTSQELKGKTGADYDKTYIAQQVAMHQQVLSALDNNLIPNAQNPDLKAHLEKLRPKVEEHLKEAQAIQAKLQ